MIDALAVRRYRLPLVRPLTLAGDQHHVRHGFVVSMHDADGRAGHGEGAPLSGFSHEAFDDAARALQAALPGLAGATVPGDITQLAGAFDEWLAPVRLPASARCAVEAAALDLVARRQGMPLRRLLNPKAADAVPVNALIPLHPPSGGPPGGPTPVDAARDAVNTGFTTLKLKVAGDPSAAAETVAAVRDAIPREVRLRLDANRAWTRDEAARFAGVVGPDGIEYIEEPLRHPDDLPGFVSGCPMAVALDETLRDRPQLADDVPAAAWILKPMLAGGFEAAAGRIRTASERGITAIISSAFESGLGLHALAELAAALTPGAAAGLDTAAWLSRDTVWERPLPGDGAIRLGNAPPTLLAGRLRPLYDR